MESRQRQLTPSRCNFGRSQSRSKKRDKEAEVTFLHHPHCLSFTSHQLHKNWDGLRCLTHLLPTWPIPNSTFSEPSKITRGESPNNVRRQIATGNFFSSSNFSSRGLRERGIQAPPGIEDGQ